ncbi:MAG: PIN domain-containing protein [Acidobacteria bacterium]|nr:PIN domain-containing protein [Acidobacteriota bacterium]
MSRPRVFLDSCVLIEGLAVHSSASQGVLILRRSLITLILAEAVYEETKRALCRDFPAESDELLRNLECVLDPQIVERLPRVSRHDVEQARRLIRHEHDAPILAAAIKARPDWLVTDNTDHFNEEVSRRTGLRIVTPGRLLDEVPSVFCNL